MLVMGRATPHDKEQGGVKGGWKWRMQNFSLDVTPVSLQTVKELLENPTQTVNDMSYFNCLDSVMENSKVSPEWRFREGQGGLGKDMGTKGKVVPPLLMKHSEL